MVVSEILFFSSSSGCAMLDDCFSDEGEKRGGTEENGEEGRERGREGRAKENLCK